MNVALTSVFISGALAIVAVVITAYSQIRIHKLNQILESSKKHQYYLEPLIRSSADLQSRIYNIVACGFIERYYHHGNKRHQDYVINNTVFLFSQFFAWTEAARIDVQFLNLKNDKKTRKLSELQSMIYSLIQTDRLGPHLIFFAGEQRAIGEKMLVKNDNRYNCIGYGEFLKCDAFSQDVLFSELRKEIVNMTENVDAYYARLRVIQHALIDLLDYLDPKKIRINENERSKLK